MNVCMIPARRGSERLRKKNYLKIGNYSVLEIAILKAIKSSVFDKIVVNTDDPSLEKITSKLGIDIYLRDSHLASSEATSDQVVLDFFQNHDEADSVIWVNTASPLQTIEDIQNFSKITKNRNWKSGVSTNSNRVHAFFKNEPLNFNWANGFAKTQDLFPVILFNYAMMGWHRDCCKNLSNGQLFDSKTTLVESSKWSGFLLKDKNDLALITLLSKVAPNQGIIF